MTKEYHKVDVYLSGPMTGLNYDSAADWRKKAKEQLAKFGIKAISPLRGINQLPEGEVFSDSLIEKISSDKAITTRDRHDVESCIIFLANLVGAKRISIGTMIEYGWAYAYRKPIITIMEKEGNPHDYSMIRELSTYRVETVEEALEIIKEFFDVKDEVSDFE